MTAAKARAPRVRSREQLLHLLAEAAELEHNLLCSYLYAAFGLKDGAADGLDATEAEAVERWRGVLMGVCIEEMLHLAQVANLMLAVGSRPHFDRPNLPVPPGYHPADIVVELAPFDRATLDHFIFLERPEGSDEADGAGYEGEPAAQSREGPRGTLMPHAPDYATIGAFYDVLGRSLVDVSGTLGETALFVGGTAHQMRGAEVRREGLVVVDSLETALAAIDWIVVQGEGSPQDAEHSHHRAFNAIAEEFARLQSRRPGFAPSRPVARNPVMRKPQAPDRMHVTGRAAVSVLDAANATYSLMLRLLVELYETPDSAAPRRQALLGGTFEAMSLLAGLARHLTTLPASDAQALPHAGVSFATLRATEGLAPGVDAFAVLAQRARDIARALAAVELPSELAEDAKRRLDRLTAALAPRA